MKQLSLSDCSDYEEQTFRNIVLHIRKGELLRIMDGEDVVKVIPQSNQRSKLLRDKVFELYYRKGGKRLTVSERARTLLEMSI